MKREPLPLNQFAKDPFAEFTKWRELAQKEGNPDVDAMTLATATKEGMPSARVVLYKGIKNGGFSFYTNYESAKGITLAENPYAALVFYWPEIYRQVRVEGKVKKMSRAESEEYFKTRPRESQLGAWASHQSRTIESLEAVEKYYADLKIKYEGKEIPCPPHWGGFSLTPSNFEFWVGARAACTSACATNLVREFGKFFSFHRELPSS